MTVAVLAVVVGIAVALGRMLAADTAVFPSTPRLTATHARPAPSAPPLVGNWASEDRRFLTAVADRVSRGPYPLRRHEALVAAGHQVCAAVMAGRSLSGASSALMIGYGLSAAQAAGVGAAAVRVYCPHGRP